jgi:hypothetical protein
VLRVPPRATPLIVLLASFALAMLPANIVFVTLPVSPVVTIVPVTFGAVRTREAVRVPGMISTLSDVVPPALPRSKMPSCVAARRNIWPVALVNVLAPVRALLPLNVGASVMPKPLRVVGLEVMPLQATEVAVAALPVQLAELPVTLIPQLPDAPVPVVLGAPSVL